ncbi:MAG: 50S ribosomal protein L24 [Candidatus Hadarchaeales archaeon]
MVSAQPRKQRMRLYHAPLHARGKFLHAPLSRELRAKIGKRALRVRKGDRVRVVKGDFKGLEGEVLSVDTKRGRVTVQGASVRKADGTEVPLSIHTSNLLILRLAEDKRRTRKSGK